MSWNDEAPGWDDNPVVRAYSAAAFASLQGVLAARGADLGAARVLDFGCGTGLLTAAMAAEARAIVALDPAPAMIDVLRGKAVPNLVAVCGTLDEVLGTADFAPASFELVTCSSVCAFLEDYPGTVAQLVPLLAPGGLFVQWDWELDPESAEPFGLIREAMERALVAAGLTEVGVDVGFELPFEDAVMAPLLGVGRR